MMRGTVDSIVIFRRRSAGHITGIEGRHESQMISLISAISLRDEKNNRMKTFQWETKRVLNLMKVQPSFKCFRKKL